VSSAIVGLQKEEATGLPWSMEIVYQVKSQKVSKSSGAA